MFKDWNSVPNCIQTTPNGAVPTLACLPVVFQNVISALLLFAGTVAAIMILYSAIQFNRSGGDKQKIAAAQKIMTYAIIGLIVVLCSFGIIFTIAYLTRTDCITKLGLDACK